MERLFTNFSQLPDLYLYFSCEPLWLLPHQALLTWCYICLLTCPHPPYTVSAAAAAKSFQSCPTLCDTMDGSPPDSPIPGIFQARTLEWIAISFSNAWKWKVKVKPLSRVWLSNPLDCSPSGSFIHGIFQVRVLEWGAIAFSETVSATK